MKHAQWIKHAEIEYRLLDEVLTSLSPSEWRVQLDVVNELRVAAR